MRGLDTTPMTRRDGRGPDGSPYKALDTRLDSCVHVVTLRTVTHFLGDHPDIQFPENTGPQFWSFVF